MKYGTVIKSSGGYDSAEEMRLINTYSRRELSPDEVYIFTVALCDNDVDRDYERFTVESLFELEKLFVGRTGIFDHDPSAKNQKARIISCRVEAVVGGKTALGDELFRLTARAYMRRTEGNAELIDAIDSGIIKEVSVGCSIGRTVCSVCRRDMYSPECDHVKGRVYEGELCVGELCEPSDAYEFSFVAVPAQRGAGVMKSTDKEKDMKDITKLLEAESLTLDSAGMKALRAYIGELRADAECIKAYRGELLDRLSDGMKNKGVELSYEIGKSISDKLSMSEIRGLIAAFAGNDERNPAPQLCLPQTDGSVGNTQFTI